LEKISNVVLRKKSKGSLKREKVFEDKKINRKLELAKKKNTPEKNKKNKKFNRRPSSKKRWKLIIAKKGIKKKKN